MREEEKYSANKLKEYLVSRGFNAVFKDGSDPPDIEFTIASQRWAVEHTQLFQYVDQSGIPQSRSKIEAINSQIEQRVRKQTEGHRKSSWVLVLYGVAKPKERKKIEQLATQSILADSVTAFSAIPPLLAELRQIPDSQGRFLGFSMLPSGSKVPSSNRPTADIQATIDFAVQTIFQKKAPTLKQLSGFDQRVLLILGQYMFVNNRNISVAVTNNTSLRNGIDKIFLVTSTGVSEVN